MPTLPFTVDSALLRELGERLVGKPHIALAELIKNSYDADASVVEVRIGADSIEVIDNGSGMTRKQFEDYWMRIGSTHKARRSASGGGRPLTGSKGVGRLAAQFLGRHLHLTTAAGRPRQALIAVVDWEKAANAGELTKAKATVDYGAKPTRFPDGSRAGTRLLITGLRQEWPAEALKALARELWALQPPFAARPGAKPDFRIELETGDADADREFRDAMQAILKLWEARIVGRLEETRTEKGLIQRRMHVDVYFNDGEHFPYDEIIDLDRLHAVDFEIRVFRLQGRQRYSIPVETAREYFRKFGGVHLYDAGFRLPYYGPETDWLDIEQDHAHRLSTSRLLPRELQVEDGLNYLPTNSRLYGVVEINTAGERRAARKVKRSERTALTIQVSRDRLVDNPAYQELRTVVRTAIDWYATRAALRAARLSPDDEGSAALGTSAAKIEDVLDEVRPRLDDDVYDRLKSAVASIGAVADHEARRIAGQAGLLGALASAGIAAVALEHETARELTSLEGLSRRLEKGDATPADAAEQLRSWIERTRSTRQLFRPLLDEESREEVRSYRARDLLAQVVDQASSLLRGMEVDLDEVPSKLRLPAGRLSEWTAVWQNVLINAANANSGVDEPYAKITAGNRRRDHFIAVSDMGSGIDLQASEEMFEPFVRRTEVRGRTLGAGGTGLGLTIVRMIAGSLGCHVRFVAPEPPYSTTFELTWRPK